MFNWIDDFLEQADIFMFGLNFMFRSIIGTDWVTFTDNQIERLDRTYH